MIEMESKEFTAFALNRILLIGSLMTDWDWRRNHKSSIVTGRPVRGGAKRGGEMRRNKLAPQTRERITAMRRLIKKGHSVTRAAELVSKDGFGTKEGNRKLWKRHAT